MQMSGDHSSSQTITSAVPLRHLSPNYQLKNPSQGDVGPFPRDDQAELFRSKPTPSLQQSIPQEPITLSSDSPSLGENDLESTYRAEDREDPLGSLNEFLDDIEAEVTGPSRVGIGKGKGPSIL